MNIKLTLAFDGTDFHGWRTQRNVVTVQETLLDAVQKIMPDVEEIQGVSRTDAGVHALEYFANFHTEEPIPLDRIVIALNSLLPDSVRVYNAEEVPADWNARFSCKSKTYVYRIWNGKICPPTVCRDFWHFPHELDIKKMKSAAKKMLGTHDFSCFCSSGAQQKNHVRTINWLKVDKKDEVVSVTINANAYLYNMVRIIVGTLVDVGNGKIPERDIERIIASCDRTRAGRTAPAKGLFLQKVLTK